MQRQCCSAGLVREAVAGISGGIAFRRGAFFVYAYEHRLYALSPGRTMAYVLGDMRIYRLSRFAFAAEGDTAGSMVCFQGRRPVSCVGEQLKTIPDFFTVSHNYRVAMVFCASCSGGQDFQENHGNAGGGNDGGSADDYSNSIALASTAAVRQREYRSNYNRVKQYISGGVDYFIHRVIYYKR
jgi:hypothetical protein